MIQFDNVSKRYPGSDEILKNISFNIDAGEFVFITGHSGAGKSTLLKLIAATELPTRGTVLVANQNVSQLKAWAIPFLRRRFGLIFQDHKLLFDRNCFENVILPLRINGIAEQEAAKRVRAALDKVGLLNKEKTMPITLSGGEQQRLAIARAVVSRPTILLADEPTGNLDADYATEIMNIFNAFHQVGVTVIMSTHDALGLSANKKRVLHLNQGVLTDTTQSQFGSNLNTETSL
ncbi:MAG: cell division ATP-binding protein FtsE [Methylotenera sp. 24-45-7]|jgi:cell division transport system ATP-binding protein|nr:MAG: cell division ATP-binding protein FtsE [Mehylophilales bacterium 35-46-6]OYZ41840.1 MAG: cell division ATP-binding protein FtsE [Methylotenera sp. 24-45-7]OZA09759.1 MAG: cell division ATP-binding protein FtsE [Methylotenera sp. 17-45-7]OZA54251.1 MAG: cell division ATP-binding protein FtsE [Methylophilales bacterium 39-45-7]HQS37122.1 cell division ATP-binding protein FtsE [Methylotenera sp.]